MRVTFVTGSLERAEDGVGDYTRWLAAEAAGRGVSCRLVSIADRHVRSPTQDHESPGIEILRLPYAAPWPTRLDAAKAFIDASPPDWLSLQFVPYSFQRWGVATTLVRAVPALAGRARLHVMFHEIWIDGGTSWRRRLVSAAQRRSVIRLGRLPGAVIHTSNETYCRVLNQHGVPAATLPLFGSIPISSSGCGEWLDPALAAVGCDAFRGKREDWWLAVLFGTLHPIWPPEPLLGELQAIAGVMGKRLALIAVGRLGSGEALWSEMCATYASRLPMLRLGSQSAEHVSQLLRMADFGVATTPLALVGKSATAAAMFEHGLPVVVNREDCCWPAPPTQDRREDALIIRMGHGFADRIRTARRLPPSWRLPEIATRWLGDLSAAGVKAH